MSELVLLNAEPEGYSAVAQEVLGRLGVVRSRELGRPDLLQEISDVDVLIVRLGHRVDQELLRAAPRLRAVVTATTGLDHVDLQAAEEQGVTVLSLRGEIEFLESIAATAEHTWALLLALLRRIPAAVDHVRAGGWDRDLFRGRELHGRRLGILGLGRVGRKVAKFGQAFGMEVHAHSLQHDPWVEGVTRCASAAQLASCSDVLSVHVPLDRSTQGLVGADLLDRLPPGALLVNTARGDLLDEQALVERLASGRMAGAALDVMRDERTTATRRLSPLLKYAADHDNLVLTPHIAGATHESMAATELFMAQKLARFLGVEPAESSFALPIRR